MIEKILRFVATFTFLALAFDLNLNSGLLAQLNLPTTLMFGTATAFGFTCLIFQFNRWLVVFLCWLLLYANMSLLQGSLAFLSSELATTIAITIGIFPIFERMIEQ